MIRKNRSTGKSVLRIAPFARTGVALLAVVCAVLPAAALAGTRFVATEPSPETRVSQAKELLGRKYAGSIVRESEGQAETAHLVRLEVRKSLKRKWKPWSERITHTILAEAARYQLDPFFLMAVIAHESHFNPETRGAHTEIGLMQIKPKTAAWIANRAGIRWNGDEDLANPVRNIVIGAAYLSYLRNRFDSKGGLYLSAYNMGPRNVNKLLDQHEVPKEYADKVMSYYLAFYLDLRDKFEEPSAEVAEF